MWLQWLLPIFVAALLGLFYLMAHVSILLNDLSPDYVAIKAVHRFLFKYVLGLPHSKDAMPAFKNSLIQGALVFVVGVYPSLVETAARSFICQERKFGKSFLLAAPEVSRTCLNRCMYPCMCPKA